MMIDPFKSAAPSPVQMQAVSFGDNEKAEKLPDNEAAESLAKAKAPLDTFQGTQLDVQA